MVTNSIARDPPQTLHSNTSLGMAVAMVPVCTHVATAHEAHYMCPRVCTPTKGASSWCPVWQRKQRCLSPLVNQERR